MPYDIQKIREAGFDTYHTKPIKVKDLTETIRIILDGRKELS